MKNFDAKSAKMRDTKNAKAWRGGEVGHGFLRITRIGGNGLCDLGVTLCELCVERQFRIRGGLR